MVLMVPASPMVSMKINECSLAVVSDWLQVTLSNHLVTIALLWD